MKILKRILLGVLILVVLSNAYVHYKEIKRMIKVEGELTTEVSKTKLLFSRIFELFDIQSRINKYLYDRINLLSKKEGVVKPDFEKLMDGTVTIYNKGYTVAGVCINEDEDCYYILTVYHLFKDRIKGIFYPRDTVPESSMGMAVKLNTIYLFLKNQDLQEPMEKSLITETTVRLRDYTMVGGEFLFVNKVFDLALLRIYKNSNVKVEVLKLSKEYPKVGDEVYVLGHPLGRKYNLSKGIVSNLGNHIYMGVDALMTFGCSGGAVFNNRGEIIGISSAVPVYVLERK